MITRSEIIMLVNKIYSKDESIKHITTALKYVNKARSLVGVKALTPKTVLGKFYKIEKTRTKNKAAARSRTDGSMKRRGKK